GDAPDIRAGHRDRTSPGSVARGRYARAPHFAKAHGARPHRGRNAMSTFLLLWLLAADAPAVALVTGLSGSASNAGKAPLAPLSWLRIGDRVRVAPGNSVTLVFANGRRFSLTGEASLSIAADG